MCLVYHPPPESTLAVFIGAAETGAAANRSLCATSGTAAVAEQATPHGNKGKENRPAAALQTPAAAVKPLGWGTPNGTAGSTPPSTVYVLLTILKVWSKRSPSCFQLCHCKCLNSQPCCKWAHQAKTHTTDFPAATVDGGADRQDSLSANPLRNAQPAWPSIYVSSCRCPAECIPLFALLMLHRWGSGTILAVVNMHLCMCRRSLSGRATQPIQALNPYNCGWTIRARVANKTPKRSYSRNGAEQTVFSVELIDAQASCCWPGLRYIQVLLADAC